MHRQYRLLAEAACNQTVLKQLAEYQEHAFARNNVADFMQAFDHYQGTDSALAEQLQKIFIKDRNQHFSQGA